MIKWMRYRCVVQLQKNKNGHIRSLLVLPIILSFHLVFTILYSSQKGGGLRSNPSTYSLKLSDLE